MNTATRSTGRSLWVATRALLLFTVVLGIGYTLLITAVGQLAFPAQANILVHLEAQYDYENLADSS